MKLQYAPAVELILIRDKLAARIKGFTPGEGQITAAGILAAADESAIPGLFEDLSLTRLRQVLKSFPTAFGDEWVSKMLGLIGSCNLRSIAEIGSCLECAEQKDASSPTWRTGLQQRTLTSDALAWICRERKGLARSSSLRALPFRDEVRSRPTSSTRKVRSARPTASATSSPMTGARPRSDRRAKHQTRSAISRAVSSGPVLRRTDPEVAHGAHHQASPEIQDLMSGRREKEEEETLMSPRRATPRRRPPTTASSRRRSRRTREDIKIARSYGDLRENFE